VSGVIRVAIVDDHHAVRLGLSTAIAAEPGLVCAGVASTAAELEPLLYRNRPDVVLLDYNLPDADGLRVCHHIRSQPLAPKVIIYSAFADHSMTVPAVLAGADGVLDKGLPARELFEAIRRVNADGSAIPELSREHFEAALAVLPDEDIPILSMLINRTPPHEIARVMRIKHTELRARTAAMLERLGGTVRPLSVSRTARP
jgi:DNA-binding NarL/FixJ family response regulator